MADTDNPLPGGAEPEPAAQHARGHGGPQAALEIAVWEAAELLGTQKEAIILHGEEVYRLRLTRNGKLILHK